MTLVRMPRLLALAILPLLSAVTPAQTAPVAEIFGGYSWLRLPDRESGLAAAGMHGWNAALKINLHQRVGLVADFGGNYGNRRAVPTPYQRLDTLPGAYRQHTVLLGPEARVYAGERFTVNVRALIGAAYVAKTTLTLREPYVQEPPLGGGPTPPPLTALTFGPEKPLTGALGGSLDYRISPRLAWRIVQPELVVIGLGGAGSRKCPRVATGLVFTF